MDSSSENENSPTSTITKRFRTRFTAHQINELEKAFKDKPLPNKGEKIKLAVKLNIHEKKINAWFQNKRMRNRKPYIPNQSQDNMPTSSNGQPDDDNANKVEISFNYRDHPLVQQYENNQPLNHGNNSSPITLASVSPTNLRVEYVRNMESTSQQHSLNLNNQLRFQDFPPPPPITPHRQVYNKVITLYDELKNTQQPHLPP